MNQLVNLIRIREGNNLSKSAYKILEIIEKKEVISPSEIVDELDVSTRTIHYSLHRLLEYQILERKPYLGDMRQSRYKISEQLKAELRTEQFLVRKV